WPTWPWIRGTRAWPAMWWRRYPNRRLLRVRNLFTEHLLECVEDRRFGIFLFGTFAVKNNKYQSGDASPHFKTVLDQPEDYLTLFVRKGLCAVRLGIELGLGLGRIDSVRKFTGRGDVIPAAVLEIDERLAVPVDRDHPANNVGEAFQLGALWFHGDELVGPFASQILDTLRAVGLHARFIPGPNYGEGTSPQFLWRR